MSISAGPSVVTSIPFQVHDAALPTERATSNREERRQGFRDARQRHGGLRLQRFGGDGGCHRVTGVVEREKPFASRGERGKHYVARIMSSVVTRRKLSVGFAKS